eukprot:1019051-Pelagomonas_calceolata.AAC.12
MTCDNLQAYAVLPVQQLTVFPLCWRVCPEQPLRKPSPYARLGQLADWLLYLAFHDFVLVC